MVLLYVEAINAPDVIPNIQKVWDTYVETKCSEAKQAAIGMYEILTSELSDQLPCDSSKLRLSHSAALQECEEHFMVEVNGISTNTVETHLGELKVSIGHLH